DVNFDLAVPTPEEIARFARDRLKGVKADVVFISCTNFRAMEAIPLLREDLGPSIITSNTATLEAVLIMERHIREGKASSH
ncbi:MAG: hypothetical protein ABIG67_07705, partial [Pseudomonadota bacterium]